MIMKTNTRHTPTTIGYLVLSFITLVSLIFGAGAAPATAALPEASTQVALDDLAAQIADEVGVVKTVVETDAVPAIFVFEERHDSVLGQVEIGIMLNRLYTEYDLRHIGLEGHSAGVGPLGLDWAHSEPYYQAGEPITGREDVLVQLLQDGEISSAEFLGLVYHDVVVHGIDDPNLYGLETPPEAFYSPNDYLFYIAWAVMSDEDYSAFMALYDEEKYEEAFDYAMQTNEFTAEINERISDRVDVLSLEGWLQVLDELAAQATEVGADIPPETEAGLAELGKYLEAGSQRSDAAVSYMLALASEYPEAPIAMTVGAGHTERVVELLTEAGVSFAVIRAHSMEVESAAGLLSPEAYDRNLQGRAVAPDGTFSASLDGRDKKPPPTADGPRIKTEAVIRQVLQELAEQAADLNNDGRSFNEIKAHLELAVGDDDVVGINARLPKGSSIEILDVLPGADTNPNPIVIIELKNQTPEGEFRSNLKIQLVSGAQDKLDQSTPLKDRLGGALDQFTVTGTDQLITESPDISDINTAPRPPQLVCSNTQVTVTQSGG